MSSLALNYQDFIIAANDEPKTTSLMVAKAFGKRHTHILDKIKNLDCSPEFSSANFSAHDQVIDIGKGATRVSTYYEMTKDGFMFLVMGFTGAAAAQVKEAYITAFNWMAAQLFKKETPAITTEAISKDQRGALFNLVARRTGKDGKLRAAMWGKLKHHYGYAASYHELKAVHFDDAVKYLEKMDLKERTDGIGAELNLDDMMGDVKNRFMDHYYGLCDEVKRLGGVVPNYPVFDGEAITKCVIGSMMQSQKMVMSFDHRGGMSAQFVRSDCRTIADGQLAEIIGHPEYVSKRYLPDIMQALMKRLMG
jgi:Rha family phage regulatory protein